MRDDGAVVSHLKKQLYQRTISPGEYAAAIAPIRARHGWLFDFWNIHWLYYAQILLVVTAALVIVLSLVTPAPRADSVRFTWYGATPAERAATRASWSSVDVVLSLIVLVAVALFYASFW